MLVNVKDGRCRSCSGQLAIIDADDATMTVECQDVNCGDSYLVETDSFGDGCMTYYLGFLAFISVSLGVLNLLPVPVLDGGHLMYYLWEGVTGKPVSEAWLQRLQYVGMSLLLCMMAIAMYNDIVSRLG